MQLDCHTMQFDAIGLHTMQFDAIRLPYDAIRLPYDAIDCHTMQLDCHTMQLECHTMPFPIFLKIKIDRKFENPNRYDAMFRWSFLALNEIHTTMANSQKSKISIISAISRYFQIFEFHLRMHRFLSYLGYGMAYLIVSYSTQFNP